MNRSLPARADVVACFENEGRALHAREIATRLGVPKGAFARFLTLLDGLAREGVIRRLSGERFRREPSAAPSRRLVDGLLAMNPRGFGFVTVAGEDDVYIAPESVGGALHGDRVEVEVLRRGPRGTEGRVASIRERRQPRVPGTVRRRRKGAWLEPDDVRLRGPIVLALASLGAAKDGEAAIAEITRFPEFARESPEGNLVRVLGAPGEPATEVLKILLREQIEEEHPEAALAEAEAMAARLQKLELEGRTDLREVPLPTLDPEDARDHDDAIWVERTKSGYRAWIAIADVSAYVEPESALDAEAEGRGCTIYLPDRAIPMLPSALAADVCSLLPDHDRLCLALIVDLDRSAVVRSFRLTEGLMRSKAMLTYGGVARALGFSDKPLRSAQAEAMKGGLRYIDELARKLRARRMKRGALDLNLPEPRVELDPKTGAPLSIRRRSGDPGIQRAYAMVEELMLLANELVATWLTGKQSPTVYRVHARPDETKLERLAEVAATFGLKAESAELLEPRGAAEWLEGLRGRPERGVLEMLLLRSLKQATYDTKNIGHFGLASDCYVHFTSPIRRYPDILVHRAVKALLRGERPDRRPAAVERLAEVAARASRRERTAMEVEREVVDLYRALHMQTRVGETFDGTLTGIGGSGVYVALDDPFVDVLVRFDALGPDRYDLTKDELGVVGARSGDSVRLGDRLRVTIEDVSLTRRSVIGRRVDGGAEERRTERDKSEARRSKRATNDTERKPKGGPRNARRARASTRPRRPFRAKGGPRKSSGGKRH